MQYNRAETITKYLNLSINENYDFSTLRNRMKNEITRVDEEEFALVLNYVDEKRRNYDAIKSDRLLGISAIYGGLALIAAGVIITLGTYLNWFGSSRMYIILYGPIFAGISALGYGFRKKGSYDHFISANQIVLKKK